MICNWLTKTYLRHPLARQLDPDRVFAPAHAEALDVKPSRHARALQKRREEKRREEKRRDEKRRVGEGSE